MTPTFNVNSDVEAQASWYICTVAAAWMCPAGGIGEC